MPIHFWVKLPAPIDELRALGELVENPYPQLTSRWDAANKQIGWDIPTVADVPDVRAAVDLTRPYQPQGGSMLMPTPPD